MNKKDQKVLQRINAEAWAKFGDKLFVEREKAPIAKKVLDLALSEQRDKLTPLQVDRFETFRDSGALEGTVREEDPEVAQKFHEFVEEKIELAIKNGELTHPKKDKEYVKKGKQIANRKKRDSK